MTTERHVFRSRNRGIGEIVLHACKEQLTITVSVDTTVTPEAICRVVVSR
jgi:hypothetical protein